ncbi:MAG: KOW motif-containing protein [Lachnospiraceae bacterium]|nr:KOW motif-containing protein [Lachnospiraceae bacterium]MCM1232966.1 KOW motif-containing protein [Ruminococcus flavefaciens]
MTKFHLGDKVRVTSGRCEGLIGTVTQVTEANEELDTGEWYMLQIPERGAIPTDVPVEILERV